MVPSTLKQWLVLWVENNGLIVSIYKVSSPTRLIQPTQKTARLISVVMLKKPYPGGFFSAGP